MSGGNHNTNWSVAFFCTENIVLINHVPSDPARYPNRHIAVVFDQIAQNPKAWPTKQSVSFPLRNVIMLTSPSLQKLRIVIGSNASPFASHPEVRLSVKQKLEFPLSL